MCEIQIRSCGNIVWNTVQIIGPCLNYKTYLVWLKSTSTHKQFSFWKAFPNSVCWQSNVTHFNWLERACLPSRFSHVWLFVTPWTVARQAPLSMGFPRQGCCSGLPFPSPGDLPDPGIELLSLMSPYLYITWEALIGEQYLAVSLPFPSWLPTSSNPFTFFYISVWLNNSPICTKAVDML